MSLVSILLISLIVAGETQAQQKKDSKKVKAPEPERVLIETKDKVELRAEWFAGTSGKETVPVILIHDWDSDRSALTPIAKQLQTDQGFAVIVPDLRGHGESLTVKGVDEELNRKRFKKPELASMIEDIDSCRRFLQEKNDLGELNLDLLVVIACGKMSIPAANWCVADWSWTSIGGVKQGQNVKSLVLISPRKKFKSLSLTAALKSPLFANKSKSLPVLLAWGDDHEASSKDSKAIYEALKKSRDEPEKFDGGDRWEKQTVFQAFYNSARESEELLRDHYRDFKNPLVFFIEKKIIDHAEEFAWQSRAVD